MHDTIRNKLLYIDIFYLQKVELDLIYVVVCKQDQIWYVWLVSTKERTAEAVAQVIKRLFATFDVVEKWF